MAMMTLPPLALYVHFPWCVRKCPYCDFNSHTLRGPLPEQSYVEALIRDLHVQAQALAGRRLVSVFLGGGTPSLFSAAAMERVLVAAREALGLNDGIEITLEANPGTIERGRFAEYRAAGINRVSLGAQSFDASQLERLGRIHSPAETCRAAEELHAAGLENFNLDLMYALPDQDVRGALRDLERALELKPAHISHYQLTIEAGTVFAGSPPRLPSDEIAADMLAACAERLKERGFGQYEISAYARTEREARHNLNYWTFGDYIGIGAGAHGKWTFADQRRIDRTTRPREPRRYVASAGNAPDHGSVSAPDLPFEFMLNALRLSSGFEVELFEARTGLSWQVVAPTMQVLRTQRLVECAGAHWSATALGARFLNDILLRFLPPGPVPGSAKSDRTAPLYTAESRPSVNERITSEIT
jgi:putative oxygen-independent coproporphyrinogen III oxidase